MSHVEADKPKHELYDEIAMHLGWDRKRRTNLDRTELEALYCWLRGDDPPDDYTNSDLRKWLVELAYLLDDDRRTQPPAEEVARYETDCEDGRARLTAAHAALLRDMVRDVAHEQVAAVEDALDPETTPEWYDG